ncbi:hypothetical protein PN498_26630 [Oscillatoria sp. CS-180]|uniref:competence protein CoiA family protein n=1 Tax=Oscillatoria sp. CS-180 TaxID=3021720 RepID=UPI00232F1142|nr:hypothetical protein [Oscillatoria sp. CS-180]MDB9529595.1 hypothetical protein [Oscillatoria sp. CS-180]
MEVARSIYLGKKIRADDSRVNSRSYREMGLRCIYCGEPVFYRAGDQRRSHFAHFPSIDPQKYEECLLRQQNKGGGPSFKEPWWQEKGGEQRFYLFQEHFIYILRTAIPDLDISPLKVEPQETELNELQSRALQHARDNLEAFLRYERIFGRKRTILEREIVGEAFDYLTVSSSRNLFKVITNHILNRTYNSRFLFDEDILCCHVLGSLEAINWLKLFEQIHPPSNNDILHSLKHSKSFVRQVNGSSIQSIYLDKGNLWLSSGKCSGISHETRIGKINHLKLIKAGWISRITYKRVEIPHRNRISVSGIHDLYESYKKYLECDFVPGWKISLGRYLVDNQDEKFSQEPSEGDLLIVDRNNSSCVRTREARIVLMRTAKSSYLNLAKIDFISLKSSFEDRKIYEFNDFLIFSDTYKVELIKNPSIAVSINDLVHEIHRLIKT